MQEDEERSLSKEQIIQRLKAINRQLTCMNESIFNSHIDNGEFAIVFDQYLFSEKNTKIQTVITMKKIQGPNDDK